MTCRRSISVAGLRPCPVGSGTHGTRIQGDAPSLQARYIRHEERKQTAGLLDLISGWMTPEVVQKLAGQAGISAGDATRAIDAIIPAQLRDVVAMSSNEAGANQLLSVLKEHEGTESFAHILLGGDAIQRQATVGETLQSAVYGNDLGRRLSSMASSLGIPQGAASSLMSLIMPVVVGLLGREVRERGLDAIGLVNFLRGERESVEGTRPTGLADRPTRQPVLEVPRVMQVAPPARSRAWLWLLLPLLGLIALGLWYANRLPQTTVTPTTVTTTDLGGTSPLPFFEGIELMAVSLLSLRYHLDRVRGICSRLRPVTTD